MTQIDQISRSLGELQGQMAALLRGMDQSDDRAEKRWHEVYNRFDEQDQELSGIRADASAVREETRFLRETLVNDVKPVTDEVKRWKFMGMGALGIVGVGGAAFGALALYFWDLITKSLKL